jgi:signal transduction histidine kinase
MENISKSWQDNIEDNSQSNQRDDFDREYSLGELLPLSVVEELCIAIQKVAPTSIALLTQDGTLFYAKGSMVSDNVEFLSSIIKQKDIDSPKTFNSGRGEITIFPIAHQLEIIGYLAMGHETNGDRATYPAVHLGNFLTKTFSHLIIHKYKYELTAGLHEQVVEESYARLKEKTTRLEASEQKYRQLAGSLEVDVQNKVREIKETQVRLMQQEKMASIGHLAAGVAHEINNPMGFVSSNLNTLNDYVKDIRSLIEQYRSFLAELNEVAGSEEGRKAIARGLERITKFEQEVDIDYVMEDFPNLIAESLEGAGRIKKIVIDLKNFAHPGEDELQFSNINKNLDSTLNVVWYELKYKAKITKEYGDLPPVKCYPQKLNQVFMNIFVNAAQAIAEKGEIKITTSSENEHVNISISDTGSGIAKENLSKIFGPFFTTKEVGEGPGLGLNVAYNIIKKHNGTIDVKSTVGKGTTFSIRLPVDD